MGRAVPVLIPEDTKAALQFIANKETRKALNVGNKFLFATNKQKESEKKTVGTLALFSLAHHPR